MPGSGEFLADPRPAPGGLCSAGRTQSGRYNAMDTVGDWTPTSVGNSFNVRLFDGALHGADYIRVYVTKPGFNPVTTALKWSDLDLVSQIGDTPAARWTSVSGGVQIDLPVALSGRTGRAMVYTIWQASHLDQSYYFCSDVAFGGPAAIKGWTVSLAYPAGQTIQQGWNATVSASGSTVTAVNAGYNGALAAGASTTFGFIGSDASTVPAASCRTIV